MAQYEPTDQQLKDLENNQDLSSATREAIKQIVGDAGAAGVAAVTGDVSPDQISAAAQAVVADSATIKEELNLSDNVSVLLLNETQGKEGGTNINMTTDDPVHAQLTQVENINLNIENNANNEVTLSNGDPSVTGTVSVETGAGKDVFNMQGDLLHANVSSGAGNDEFVMDEAAQQGAEVSVDAGDGFDLLRLLGDAIKHQFSYSNGHFHMHSADVQLSGVDVIGIDADENGKIELNGKDFIKVLATNAEDSIVAKLYKVAFGREAIDGDDGWGDSTLGGINWWMNEFEKQDDSKVYGDDEAGYMEHLVRSFLNCKEFDDLYKDATDAEYVNALLTNANATDLYNAEELVARLESGDVDRQMLAWEIADNEKVQLIGQDGQLYVIDGFDENA